MKILIFGGNRFVGKLITTQLFYNGYDVTVVNRSGTSPVNCNIIKCDRNNASELKNVIVDTFYDCVIDLCLYNYDQAVITTEILKNNCSKYIFVSSAAVYSDTDMYPLMETHDIDGGSAFGQYGIDKSNIEKYFCSVKNFPYINVRPSYILGKENHIYREKYFFDQIMTNQTVEIESDGNALLSFVFAEDVANIICNLITMTSELRTSYNICNDEYISIHGFARMIASILNKSLQIEHVSNSIYFRNVHCLISNQKIKQVFSQYKFKTLKQGLTEFYEYTY